MSMTKLQLPAPGDLVTLTHGGARVFHATVRRVFNDTDDSTFQIVGSTAHYSLGDEGTWWIRGHHADDSAEVHALKAAFSLAYGKLERYRRAYGG